MADRVNKGLAPEVFTPSDQKGKSDATTFTIRPMDGLEYADVVPEIQRTTSGKFLMSGTGIMLTLQRCMSGWTNVVDEKGAPLPFAVENIRYLSTMRLQEICARIIAISDLTEAERKN